MKHKIFKMLFVVSFALILMFASFGNVDVKSDKTKKENVKTVNTKEKTDVENTVKNTESKSKKKKENSKKEKDDKDDNKKDTAVKKENKKTESTKKKNNTKSSTKTEKSKTKTETKVAKKETEKSDKTTQTTKKTETKNTQSSSNKVSLGTYKLTFYCPCSQCCDNSDGITASGTKATAGRTIAAPSNFKFGTKVEINGNTYVVEDRGGKIKGNRIDIFCNSHQEALNRGIQYAEVFIYK